MASGRTAAALAAATLAVAVGAVAVGAGGAVFSPAPAVAQELVYFHDRGCPYCARWEAEIAPMYDKTWEAGRFPLRRQRLGDGVPDDLRLDRPVQYTPTFVLVDGAGREVGRVTGYSGEYFWAFLDDQIGRYDARQREGGQAPPSSSRDPSPCATPGAC